MDRGHEVRPALAGLAQRDDRAGGDRLGAVHVGVDDVGPDLGEVGGQGADRDRVVRVVDDEDGDAGPLELAHGAARRQRHHRHVVAGCGRSGSPASRGAPGRRRSCRSPGPRRRGSADRASGGPLDRRQARSQGSGCAHVSRSVAGRARAGSARPPRPTRTCTARCRAGSRAGARPRPARARRSAWTISDARRQVAGVGIDAGVVVEVAVVALEVDPGRDPPAADRQERQPERAVRAVQLEQPPEEDPALRAAGRVGEQAVVAPPFWCRSMKVSRSASGSGESSSRTSPTASARRTLRRISWRSFLPSVDR